MKELLEKELNLKIDEITRHPFGTKYGFKNYYNDEPEGFETVFINKKYYLKDTDKNYSKIKYCIEKLNIKGKINNIEINNGLIQNMILSVKEENNIPELNHICSIAKEYYLKPYIYIKNEKVYVKINFVILEPVLYNSFNKEEYCKINDVYQSLSNKSLDLLFIKEDEIIFFIDNDFMRNFFIEKFKNLDLIPINYETETMKNIVYIKEIDFILNK